MKTNQQISYDKDTIASLITAPGLGAVAVIRVSGPGCLAVINKLFVPRTNGKLKPRRAYLGNIVFNGSLLDEALLTWFKGPRSYTGEDLAEIACHGNPFIAGKVLEAVLGMCRPAEPGEFTRRAFFNGRLDLTAAEAVGDLYKARTIMARQAALNQLQGGLAGQIHTLMDELTRLRTLLELEIDFREQGLDSLDTKQWLQDAKTLHQQLTNLVAGAQHGIIVRDGLRVVLAGPPNAGKSSLFNAFLQTQRAIVTPVPGTTRDYLEEAISLNGYLVRVFDTAGLRQAKAQAEQIGVDITHKLVQQAHVVLYVSAFDAEESQELEFPDNVKLIKVKNKCDLDPVEAEDAEVIGISALTGQGMDKLKDALLQCIAGRQSEEHAYITNVRQADAVKRAVQALQQGIDCLAGDGGYEFAAFDLAQAAGALGEVIGIVDSEVILDGIFSNFCVGK